MTVRHLSWTVLHLAIVSSTNFTARLPNNRQEEDVSRYRRLSTASRVERPQSNILENSNKHGYFTQRWSVYFSNPRAVSIFLTPRVQQFGSGRYQFVPMLEGKLGDKRAAGVPAGRWMASLFPKDVYATSRGQAMNRFVAFLMPPSLVLRKMDGFGPLWGVTHDPRTLPMVVADEYCEPMFTGELKTGGRKGWRGPFLRNYWDDSVVGGRVKYVPLGPRFEFGLVTAEEMKPPLARKHLFNMMASLDTNEGRQALQARLKALIKADRASHAAASTHAGSGGDDGAPRLVPLRSGFIHNADEWANALPTEIVKGKPVPTAAYRDVLLGSVFTLCPQGHSPETFRLFEAAEAGSIPIVEFGGTCRQVASAAGGDKEDEQGGGAAGPSHTSGACVNPWRPFLESKAPFVWVKDWSDVDNVLTVLGGLSVDKVELMQRAVRHWYTSFMTSSVGEVEEVLRDHLSRWLVEKQDASMAATKHSVPPARSRVPPKALSDLVKSHKLEVNKLTDPAAVERLQRVFSLHEAQKAALLRRWKLESPSAMIGDKRAVFFHPNTTSAAPEKTCALTQKENGNPI